MSSDLAWPIQRIRQTFVDFFVKKYNHTFVPTSATVPRRDPTLLFTNAGMNQFKDLFLGTADPNTEFGKMKRAANSQLCIRAGGKHNDLEDVGRDTYHHTLFEMLGNWSFGDYFKKDAINMAWELLVDVYKIPKDRLYATYYEGNPSLNIAPDNEAKELWCQYLPPERVMPFGKENFWEMGDTGPCGPCSEVHFDHIGNRDARHLVNRDDPTVVEIWNLVFMQFNRDSKGLHPLPAPHVDTGAGLERLAAVLQGVKSNYDTDCWSPIFDAIQKVTKYRHSYNYDGPDKSQDAIVAYRVIADHIRCCLAAISDGAMPDRVGRGFVVRRIIRRAVRFGRQFLGAETGFFHLLADSVAETLGSFFPHLKNPRTLARVKAILADEEASFARTWKVGLKHFENAKAAVTDKMIAAKDAFVLHDRYGFPLDLTQLMAEKEGLKVDVEGFWREMKTNQTSGGRMQAAKTFIGTLEMDDLQKASVPLTIDTAKYILEPSNGQILRMFDKKSGKFISEVSAAEESSDSEENEVGLLLNATSFYSEAGGQTYDTGSISAKDGTFCVEKVFCYGGYVFHIGRVAEGSLRCGDEVELNVNYERRLPIAVNHTCTHILNHALRDVLQYENPAPHMEVNQRGSFVSDDYFRFDFSWNAKMTRDEIRRTEEKICAAIERNDQVFSMKVSLGEAQSINSLRCMFDEKYPEVVTVVAIGVPIESILAEPSSEKWKKYSIELCGGTHIPAVGSIDRAVLVSEEAIMKGIRRMFVLTGRAAIEASHDADTFFQQLRDLKETELDPDDKLKKLSILVKNVNDCTIPLLKKFDLRDAIESEIAATNAAKKQAAALLKLKATEFGETLMRNIPPTDHFYVFSTEEVGAEREALAAITETIGKGRPDVGVFLIGVDAKKDKALAVVMIPSAHATKGLDAIQWVRKACFGKGGGKPTAAQGGLTAQQVPEAFAAAKAEAAEMEKRIST